MALAGIVMGGGMRWHCPCRPDLGVEAA